MPIPERSQELIQKYLDALASEAELCELERLLAADQEVAQAFAEMARLHANLQDYFRKQYKMEQVAALLNAPESTASPDANPPNGESNKATRSGASVEPLPLRSTFTPRYQGPFESRRGAVAGQFQAIARKWKQIAVAALILMMCVTLWSLHQTDGGRPRLISGHLTVAGRNVSQVPESGEFEVAGQDTAVIQLPGGARIELVATTRAAMRRDADQFVVELASGGGEFIVRPDQPSYRVKTELGVVTTNDGRFSLNLVTALPAHVSSTVELRLPRLVVVVALGSVTVKHAGVSTTLSAGQEQVFVNPVST